MTLILYTKQVCIHAKTSNNLTLLPLLIGNEICKSLRGMNAIWCTGALHLGSSFDSISKQTELQILGTNDATHARALQRE